MRSIEVKVPMFGNGGLLSVPIQAEWVGSTLASLAVERSAKGISRGSAEFHNSIATAVAVEIVVEHEGEGVSAPYLRIVFGVEDDPEIFQEDIDRMIDLEVKKRKPPAT